jgi:hypothetical protein
VIGEIIENQSELRSLLNPECFVSRGAHGMLTDLTENSRSLDANFSQGLIVKIPQDVVIED